MWACLQLMSDRVQQMRRLSKQYLQEHWCDRLRYDCRGERGGTMTTRLRDRSLITIMCCVALIFGFGCSSEPEKFNPPLSSYQDGFYTYSDGNVTLKVKGAAINADFLKGSRITPLLGRK